MRWVYLARGRVVGDRVGPKRLVHADRLMPVPYAEIDGFARPLRKGGKLRLRRLGQTRPRKQRRCERNKTEPETHALGLIVAFEKMLGRERRNQA